MDGRDVRRIALALPGAEERLTWDVHPTFRVRNRIFAILSEHGDSVDLKATREAQAAYVGSEPETFFVPGYVGRHGWIGVRLERADPQELRELVEEAWRLTAPRRLVAAYDG